MDKDEICECLFKCQSQSCTVQSIVVSNHCPWDLNQEKSSLPLYCVVFSYQAVIQDRCLAAFVMVEAPEDIFEDTGSTVGVLLYAFFN